MKRSRTSPRGASADAPAFVWRRGVQLAGTAVWCDARRAQAICFLSHASAGRQPAHAQLIATPTTLALLGGAELLGAGHLSVPYRKRFTLGVEQLELVPNGHGLGSAALYATSPARTALYLGRPRVRGNAWDQVAEVRPVDALCVDVGAGLATTSAPSLGERVAGLARQIAASDAGDVVVACETLLLAHEAAWALGKLGLTVAWPKALRRGDGEVPQAGALTTAARPASATPRVAIALAARPSTPRSARDPRPRFQLGGEEALTVAELCALIDRARPRQLFLTGAGAAQAQVALAQAGVRSSTVLAPPWQMSLFS